MTTNRFQRIMWKAVLLSADTRNRLQILPDSSVAGVLCAGPSSSCGNCADCRTASLDDAISQQF